MLFIFSAQSLVGRELRHAKWIVSEARTINVIPRANRLQWPIVIMGAAQNGVLENGKR